jgi:nitroreductase
MPDRSAPLLPDPWQVSPGDFPGSASRRNKLLFLLNYAVLAPSILNSQPWLFELSHQAIAVYANPSRQLAVVDPMGRQSIISCGAALFNLRVAAQAFGYEIEVSGPSRKSDPALLAKLQLKPSATAPSQLDLQLRDAIPSRRTVRSAFEDKPLEDALLRDLADAARKEGADCHFAQAPEHKRQVAELVSEAEQFIWAIRHSTMNCETGSRNGVVKATKPCVKSMPGLALPPAGRPSREITSTCSR